MLYVITVILLILWLLGYGSGWAIGTVIQILLIIALVLLLNRSLGGRRAA